jgi:hypothetical protein
LGPKCAQKCPRADAKQQVEAFLSHAIRDTDTRRLGPGIGAVNRGPRTAFDGAQFGSETGRNRRQTRELRTAATALHHDAGNTDGGTDAPRKSGSLNTQCPHLADGRALRSDYAATTPGGYQHSRQAHRNLETVDTLKDACWWQQPPHRLQVADRRLALSGRTP